jgi:hypothetical protein
LVSLEAMRVMNYIWIPWHQGVLPDPDSHCLKRGCLSSHPPVPFARICAISACCRKKLIGESQLMMVSCCEIYISAPWHLQHRPGCCSIHQHLLCLLGKINIDVDIMINLSCTRDAQCLVFIGFVRCFHSV